VIGDENKKKKKKAASFYHRLKSQWGEEKERKIHWCLIKEVTELIEGTQNT